MKDARKLVNFQRFIKKYIAKEATQEQSVNYQQSHIGTSLALRALKWMQGSFTEIMHSETLQKLKGPAIYIYILIHH